jgi:salicylate biosynthesis isochorismate synthase/menaquinone-specific isochorismate synthase
MPRHATASTPTCLLGAAGARRLEERLHEGLRRARERGAGALISITAPTEAVADPSALVAASRRPGEPWFCFEQPDRHGFALAALGCVQELKADGPDRFEHVAARWRALVSHAFCDAPDGPPGSGLVALGGFAFAPHGGASPGWEGFEPASLIVPELSLARSAGATWITVNAEISPDDTPADVLGRVSRRLGGLRQAPLPLLDPSPIGRHDVVSPIPPAHYEEAVARAVSRIRAGELSKIVLAREVEVHAPQGHDPAAVFALLRDAFSSCFVFAVGRGNATFIAASPELLIRKEGRRASTVALAGSIRRSADPAVDDHLGEQLLRSEKDRQENEIVAHRIARALRPHAIWVTTAPEPGLVRVANIQHLARPIRAQLASSLGAIELAGLLHPTPAVGAEPEDPGLALIPALEGFDRGWYAAPVGFADARGDGEFCVALRCALLRGRVARCYAGCGIVRDSQPEAELAESEVKLQVMLPLLAG